MALWRVKTRIPLSTSLVPDLLQLLLYEPKLVLQILLSFQPCRLFELRSLLLLLLLLLQPPEPAMNGNDLRLQLFRLFLQHQGLTSKGKHLGNQSSPESLIGNEFLCAVFREHRLAAGAVGELLRPRHAIDETSQSFVVVVQRSVQSPLLRLRRGVIILQCAICGVGSMEEEDRCCKNVEDGFHRKERDRVC